MAVLPPQAIKLRDVVLPLVGLTNNGPMASRQSVQFMALHGLSSIKDFNFIEPVVTATESNLFHKTLVVFPPT